MRNAIERATVGATQIEILLSKSVVAEGQDRALTLPWTRPSSRRRREIIQGVGEAQRPQRAMRTKARDGFIKALRDAHRWLDELLVDPTQTIESLAVREGKSERSIRMTLSLAFISPVLAKAAMEGRLPRAFSVKRLTDLPMLCSEQWRAVGLRSRFRRKPNPADLGQTAIHSLQILPPRSIWQTRSLGSGLSISGVRETEFCGLRLAGDIGRGTRENGRNGRRCSGQARNCPMALRSARTIQSPSIRSPSPFQTRVAPSPRCSSSMTCAILVARRRWCRGDVAVWPVYACWVSASARFLHQAPDQPADALVRAMARHRTAGAGSGSSRTPLIHPAPFRAPRILVGRSRRRRSGARGR